MRLGILVGLLVLGVVVLLALMEGEDGHVEWLPEELFGLANVDSRTVPDGADADGASDRGPSRVR